MLVASLHKCDTIPYQSKWKAERSRHTMSKTIIRRLSNDGLDFAQSIRSIAGWNQTDRDWRRLFDSEPEGCFLAEMDGQPAGTATTTSYGVELAWIGMILVHPEYRRRGVATRLMDHCLAWLTERMKVRCVKLDATPLGREVYEKLGFQDEFEITRWEGHSTPGYEGERSKFDSATIRELDRKAFGADRLGFLKRLASDSRRILVDTRGFGMLRDGSNADYLGPIVSREGESGCTIVRSLLQCPDVRPVFWDIPEDNAPAVHLARELGFRRQRLLIRMWTGQQKAVGDPAFQWAISGPETG
jgi:GNAT superfamily N-acetyltransferase